MQKKDVPIRDVRSVAFPPLYCADIGFRSTLIAPPRRRVETKNCHLHPQRLLQPGQNSLHLFRRPRSFPKLHLCAEDDQASPNHLNITPPNQAHLLTGMTRPVRPTIPLQPWMVVLPGGRRSPTSCPIDSRLWINLIFCMRKGTSSISNRPWNPRNRTKTSPRDSLMPWPTKPLPNVHRRTKKLGDHMPRPYGLRLPVRLISNLRHCTSLLPSGPQWSQQGQ